MSENFNGQQKNLNYFLASFDKTIIHFLLPHIPPWMGTVPLTLLTILWSFLIVGCGYLANIDIRWLWVFNGCILLQHATDMMDGAVGRVRNEGLVKWGFYMDHFLDYIFLCAVVIGYSFLLPSCLIVPALLVMAICGGFMVHFFLDFAITHDFKISFNQFGSSEIRYVLILVNVILIFTGKQIFPYLFCVSLFIFCAVLCVVVGKSQSLYRAMDKGTPKREEKLD